VFTGALASFGLETSKKRGDAAKKVSGSEGSVQTIRVETPIKIIGAEVVDPPKPKP